MVISDDKIFCLWFVADIILVIGIISTVGLVFFWGIDHWSDLLGYGSFWWYHWALVGIIQVFNGWSCGWR